MKNFSQEAFLTQQHGDSRYQITFKGITYKPTANANALGALLFGLQPAGVRFDCKTDPKYFMYFARHAALILHLRANGPRPTLEKLKRVPLSDIKCWVTEAASLAPTDALARDVKALIDATLGPRAWLDE